MVCSFWTKRWAVGRFQVDRPLTVFITETVFTFGGQVEEESVPNTKIITMGGRFLAMTAPLGVVTVLGMVTLLGACSSPPTVRIVVDRVATVAPRPPGPSPIDVAAIHGPGAVESNAVVDAEVDGDTIRVALADGTKEKIRLIGIDTPETKKPGAPIGCFGPEASHFTAALIPVGTPIALELDVEPRDKYGRLLAYVRRADDGLFINEALAAYGYAMVLTYPPNVAYTDRFVEAVATARDQNLGLWGGCSSQ
jgi:micrococcal nuclease